MQLLLSLVVSLFRSYVSVYFCKPLYFWWFPPTHAVVIVVRAVVRQINQTFPEPPWRQLLQLVEELNKHM